MSATTADTIHPDAIEAAEAQRWRLYQPHNAAFWIWAWMMLNGLYLYLVGFTESAVHPSAFVIAITLELVYTLPLWWFIARADRFDRQSPKLALIGFLWGGLVSTWMMGAPANSAVLSLWAKLVSVDFATSWGPSLTAPFTEETAKFSGLLIIVLLARRAIRSAYDGIILGAFVGLGFQVFENVQYIVNGIESNFNQSPVQQALIVFGVRSATGFYTHAVFSAVIGGGFGYALNAKNKSTGHRVAAFVGIFFLGMLAHGMLDAVGVFRAGYFLSPLLGLGGLYFLWKYADRGERTWIRTLMADEVASGVITETELDVIAGSRKTRKSYLKNIKKTEGKAAAKQADHVLEAEYDLAAALAANDPSASEIEHARDEITRVRNLQPA